MCPLLGWGAPLSKYNAPGDVCVWRMYSGRRRRRSPCYLCKCPGPCPWGGGGGRREYETWCVRGAHAVRARCVNWGDFVDPPTCSTVKSMYFEAVKGTVELIFMKPTAVGPPQSCRPVGDSSWSSFLRNPFSRFPPEKGSPRGSFISKLRTTTSPTGKRAKREPTATHRKAREPRVPVVMQERPAAPPVFLWTTQASTYRNSPSPIPGPRGLPAVDAQGTAERPWGHPQRRVPGRSDPVHRGSGQ